MAYCKRCTCKYIMIFDQMGAAPLRCPKCQRFVAFLPEEEYREPAEEEVRKDTQEQIPEQDRGHTQEQLPEQPEGKNGEKSPEQPEGKSPEQSQDPEQEEPEATTSIPAPIPGQGGAGSFRIYLETPDGELSIPVTEKTVVGRNAMGREYLCRFPDVTRQHLTIAPRANGITAKLTDHSSCGTYVNGTRMVKDSSVVVSNYSEIRLASRVILLVRVKEV